MASPFWDNYVLLLHYDGEDGKHTFRDSSGFAKRIHAQREARISTTSPKFGTGVGQFDTYGDCLIVDSGDENPAFWEFLHASGYAWTYDEWLQITDLATDFNTLFATCTGDPAEVGIFVGINTARDLEVVICNGAGTDYRLNASFAALWPNDGARHHLQIEGSPGDDTDTVRVWLDGVYIGAANAVAATTPSTDPCTAGRLFIGAADAVGDTRFVGNRDELRLINGYMAQYSTNGAVNFTPPTAAYVGRVVNGTVTDADGNPAERLVIAINPFGGLFGSDPVIWSGYSGVDGSYEFDTFSSELAVIVVDEGYGDEDPTPLPYYNYLIKRLFVYDWTS